jgi:hypothetical protein
LDWTYVVQNVGMNQLSIARELNAIGMPTARRSRGGWTSASVGNVMRRCV